MNAVPGIRFVSPAPDVSGPSSRADVAVFVGLIARDPAPLATALRQQLACGGWVPMRLPDDGDSAAHRALLGLPVPVESWEAFTALYRWNTRPIEPGSSALVPCNLGVAVRSFFLEGGRKAYVVRTGDPLPIVDMDATPEAFGAAKRALVDWADPTAPDDVAARVPLLPGLVNPHHDADPGRPETWRGMAAIFGIDDAALLLLPDLIELYAGMPEPRIDPPAPPGPPEAFRPCAPGLPAALPDARPAQPELRAARLTRDGYAAWSAGMKYALDLLGRPRGPAHRRDVMLVGAWPLPLVESGLDRHSERNPLVLLGQSDAVIDDDMLFAANRIGNARLQLAYPWIETAASSGLPERVQSPEGAFAGMLARSAMEHGAFHSAAGQRTRSVLRLAPELDQTDLAQHVDGLSRWLGERLSLFGRRYGEIALLSDATLADSRAWRPGGISRLMGIILRAARSIGQDLIFEPNGPQVWDQLRAKLEGLLEGLRQRGALAGDRPGEAYDVRCDLSTMTQNDIDAGRAIVSISFVAAFPVERITVSLALLEPVTAFRRAA